MSLKELVDIFGSEKANYVEKTLELLKKYWKSGESANLYKLRFDVAEKLINESDVSAYAENAWEFSPEEMAFLSRAHKYIKYGIGEIMLENNLIEIDNDNIKITPYGIEVLGLNKEESFYVFEALNLLESELSYHNQLKHGPCDYRSKLQSMIADKIVERNAQRPFAPKENESYHILRYAELKIWELMKELHLVEEIPDDKACSPAKYVKITEMGRKELCKIEKQREESRRMIH